MFLKKTPKPKGIYLAITESYYDKEKKTTRQKTIMGLGYLDALKEKYPDPIAHFEQVVADMNLERENKKNSVVYVDQTTALSPGEHALKNTGYGILKQLYKELQLDIFWRTKTWNLSLPYNIEEVFRYMVLSQALYPNLRWMDCINRGYFFKEPEFQELSSLKSAAGIIWNYQKELQKWIFQHSRDLWNRDFSEVSFSTQKLPLVFQEKLQIDFLADHNGIPVFFNISSCGISLNQSISNMKQVTNRLLKDDLEFAVTDCDNSDFGLWLQNRLFLECSQKADWNENNVGGFCVTGFTAYVLLETLRHKLDFRFSRNDICASLQQYNCVQIAGNIYQFTYFDQILEACENALGLELHNKYRSQLQIRRLLRY